MNDVSVYLGRQRERGGGGSSTERTSLRVYRVVSVPSTGIFVEKRTMLKMQDLSHPPLSDQAIPLNFYTLYATHVRVPNEGCGGGY